MKTCSNCGKVGQPYLDDEAGIKYTGFGGYTYLCRACREILPGWAEGGWFDRDGKPVPITVQTIAEIEDAKRAPAA